MRFGLWGQVRRRWGLKGKKIIQRMQIVFRWSYLVLAVNVMRGENTLRLVPKNEPAKVSPHI